MVRKKSFSKSLALVFAMILVLPMIAFVVSACGSKNYYKVTFYDEDKETVLQYVKVEEGEEAVYKGTLPTKPSTSKYYYVFKSWVDENGNVADLTEVKKDMSVYAHFEQKNVEYTLRKPSQVTVTKRGSALSDGAKIYYGDEILVSYTESSGHAMTAFKLNGTNIQNNTLYTVKGNVEIVYQEDVAAPTIYTVKFVGPTGEVVDSQEVEKNKKAQKPNFSSDTYNLLSWNFNFDDPITQNKNVEGFFVKKSDLIEGATLSITGENENTVINANFTETCDIYKVLQNELGVAEALLHLN